jgi:type IV secretory pathway TrbF-like protein
MPPTVADLPHKTLPGAQRQFVEIYGSSLVLNTYLKLALLMISTLALGLLALNFKTQAQASHVKPLIIRIDDVGRAEAVSYDAATAYRPQPPELRYFLTQFIVKHFSRVRATLQREFPESLFFLEPALLETTMTSVNQNQVLETFMGRGASEEIEIEVKNVTLSELNKTPYKAAVDFEQKVYTTGTRSLRKREIYVAQLDFVLHDSVPASFIPVNPLGLQITYFRVDQAFQ